MIHMRMHLRLIATVFLALTLIGNTAQAASLWSKLVITDIKWYATPTTIKLAWQTTRPAKTTVYMPPRSQNGTKVYEDNFALTVQFVKLENLKPDTEYAVEIVSTGSWWREASKVVIVRTTPDKQTAQTPPTSEGTTQKSTLIPDVLQWPLPNFTTLNDFLISDFGFRNTNPGSKYHFGLDLRAGLGTPVYAAAAGTVSGMAQFSKVKYLLAGKEQLLIANPDFWVAINHEDAKLTTLYFHLADIYVRNGQEVKAGQLIGLSGPISKYGPHLDFRVCNRELAASRLEIAEKSVPVCPNSAAALYDNPLKYLPNSNEKHLPQINKVLVGRGANAQEMVGKIGEVSGMETVPVNGSTWLGINITTVDKDIENVKVVVRHPDGSTTDAWSFDYYTGKSDSNPWMSMSPKSTDAYVRNELQKAGVEDEFFWHVTADAVPNDGGIHYVQFQVQDIYGHLADHERSAIPVTWREP